jgi:hypothetical protein
LPDKLVQGIGRFGRLLPKAPTACPNRGIPGQLSQAKSASLPESAGYPTLLPGGLGRLLWGRNDTVSQALRSRQGEVLQIQQGRSRKITRDETRLRRSIPQHGRQLGTLGNTRKTSLKKKTRPLETPLQHRTERPMKPRLTHVWWEFRKVLIINPHFFERVTMWRSWGLFLGFQGFKEPTWSGKESARTFAFLAVTSRRLAPWGIRLQG